MDLEDVDGHATGRGELLVADMALEVLGLLVLHQNLLVVEFPVAVIAPNLGGHSLLLLPHLASLGINLSTVLKLIACIILSYIGMGDLKFHY